MRAESNSVCKCRDRGEPHRKIRPILGTTRVHPVTSRRKSVPLVRESTSLLHRVPISGDTSRESPKRPPCLICKSGVTEKSTFHSTMGNSQPKSLLANWARPLGLRRRTKMCAYRRSGHRPRRQANGVIICEQGALICACALIWESGKYPN